VKSIVIQKAAVLGAGVMGAQIAAHLANAGFDVALFDLPSAEGDRNQIVKAALDRLKKLEPAPIASPRVLTRISACNFDDHLKTLGGCQLIIEAVAERMDIKRSLYTKIAPYISEQTWFATNTSGLSIEALAKELPANLHSRFCGVHFFNPPRYMSLVELIPTAATHPVVLDTLETWLTRAVGKTVVRAKDTPNFIANRIGVFSLLATMHHTQAFGLGLDVVDALTGPRIGRPKSASYRTVDVVGLDTLGHVVNTMDQQLPNDPWHSIFRLPAWMTALIERGALGQKTGAGIYRKQGKEILVLDLAAEDYRKSDAAIDPEVEKILGMRNPAEQLKALRDCNHPQAQFLWAISRDVFHYSAFHLKDIAQSTRELDTALRCGFGWAMGPFETWQAAGWQAIAAAIEADVSAGKTIAKVSLPDWARDPQRASVNSPKGSYSPADKNGSPRSVLTVYQRQIFPQRLLGELEASQMRPPEQWAGETISENSGVRLWRLPQQDQGIGILSFKSKMHTVDDDVLAGIPLALKVAEEQLDGVVLWHEPPFSVGANLKQVSKACAAKDFASLEAMVAQFQVCSQALKYCRVPVVAAAQGLALGGGCEFLMHAHHRVMALETYAGLVEAGVGVIPAGGGCKEFAVRAAQWAAQGPTPAEVFPFIQEVFTTIAMAKVAKSALQVIDMGFGKPSDQVVFHPHEILHVAINSARAMADAGFAPPAPPAPFPVAGRTGIANLSMMLVNMHAGKMISDHDYKVALAAATALCGGDVDAGTLVTEDWIIEVERQRFMALLKNPQTQARIQHMLETGKALRN